MEKIIQKIIWRLIEKFIEYCRILKCCNVFGSTVVTKEWKHIYTHTQTIYREIAANRVVVESAPKSGFLK